MQHEFIDAEGRRWALSANAGSTIVKLVSLSLDGEPLSLQLTINRSDDGTYILPDGSRAVTCKVGDHWWVHHQARTYRLLLLEPGYLTAQKVEGGLLAAMPGKILEFNVSEVERISSGQVSLILEAMKMEHRVLAPEDGVVLALHCVTGQRVEQGAVLIELGTDG